MNILLLSPGEASADRVVLQDRRSEHVATVLKKQPGERLRVGVLRGGKGTARVVSVGPKQELELDELELVAENPPRTHLLLCLPRPKGLSRILQAAASFGVAAIHLVDAWKVPKEYFESPRLAPERVRQDLLLGLEQGGQTWLPDFSVQRGFARWTSDWLRTGTIPETERVVLHPGGDAAFCELPLAHEGELALAFGPDGGFIEREVETLEAHGFRRRVLGTPVLRTEVAVAAGLGQLEALRRQALPLR